MLIQRVVVGPIQTNCYLVARGEGAAGVVIDPGDEAPRILRAIEEARMSVRYILLTHGHFDHLLALAEVRRATGAETLIHPADAPLLADAHSCGAAAFGMAYEPCAADRMIEDGEKIDVGEIQLATIHTPGHSPGGLSFLLRNPSKGPDTVFTGDALFCGSVGRTDLPLSSPDLLLRSIREKLLCLPEETRALPGHGPETTIGRELRTNPFFAYWKKGQR